LELSDRGGHVGFVQGTLPGRPVYWLDHRIPAFLKQVLAQD
ncbi:MAG: hydrolase, partial [Candidatus Thiodiazotropha endolucinida]|nr:hydrolase [Candidatus Thiodiazotropha taylori]MCW4331355.1 hydrolase [Candidatus Thiodiazotropha endolucinida]